MYGYVTKVSSPHLQALPFCCWKYISIKEEVEGVGEDAAEIWK